MRKTSVPSPAGYPTKPKGLGEHLLRARLDRRRSQVDVAGELGVSTWTLRNWERGRTRVSIGSIPAVLDFLGYDPLPEPASWGGWLKRERLRRGITQQDLAALLEVDRSTVRAWERGGPVARTWRERVEEVLRLASLL